MKQEGEGKFDATDTYVPTDAVRVYLAYLQIQRNVSAFWVDKEGAKLWNFCATSIKRYHLTVGWEVQWKGWNRTVWEDGTYAPKSSEELLREDKNMSAQCLTIIAEYDEALALHKTKKNTLPDELLDALGVFVDLQDVSRYSRFEQARKNHVVTKAKAESK